MPTGPARVEYVGLHRGGDPADDRVVVAIEAKVRDYILTSDGERISRRGSFSGEAVDTFQYWTLAKRDPRHDPSQRWIAVSIEDAAESGHELTDAIIAAPEYEVGNMGLADGSLMEVSTSSGSAPPAAGPYLQTVSGRRVNPFDPDPEQIEVGDIARALANQCRFGGHCRVFYSVAQHCVIVSRIVEERGGDVEDAFAALMHDAGEAYLGDMPHPIKHRSALGAAFREAEARLEETIRDRFRIKSDVPEIKRVDRALLATERRAFSAEVWHWPELDDVEPLELELTAWSPDKAADEFAKRYAELEARR